MGRQEVYSNSCKKLFNKAVGSHENQKCMHSTEKTKKETRQEYESKLKKGFWGLICKQLITTTLSLKRK